MFQGELEADKHGELVKTYSPGGFFGERALLYDEKRGATVRRFCLRSAVMICEVCFQIWGH